MAAAVVVFSGGLDSTVAAYLASVEVGDTPHLLTVDYGQRHHKEVEHARKIAGAAGWPIEVVDLRSVGRLLKNSALTSDAPVPDGAYNAPVMRATVVPNRNPILLAVAFGWAANIGAKAVVVGVHSGDHFIYPDCRPEFVDRFREMENAAIEGAPYLWAPFVSRDKAYIVREGSRLGAPLHLTWSCYKGGEIHCGTCGTCHERKEAFRDAGIDDPTEYAA